MAKFMYTLLFLTVTSNIGLCLKCYECNAPKSNGCLKKAKPSQKDCSPPQNEKALCFYKEHYENKKIVQITSGCTTDKRHHCISDLIGNTKCRTCEKDLCNSSSGLVQDFMYFFLLVLFTFVVNFL